MRVIDAWRAGYTGKGVTVTILDDGVEHDHPDLKMNYNRLVHIFFFKRYRMNVLDTHLQISMIHEMMIQLQHMMSTTRINMVQDVQVLLLLLLTINFVLLVLLMKPSLVV